MAVSISDITVAQTSGASVTSLTTPAMTITSNPNRGGVIGVEMFNNASNPITGSIGGVSGTIIANSDTGAAQGYRALSMGVINPPSGSQTATVTVSFAMGLAIGAIATSGVDQTVGFNNGNFASSAVSGSPSLSITSNNGDLTVDTQANNGNSGTDTTNQTSQWFQRPGASTTGAGGTGPGTGTTTHTWTTAGNAFVQSGCNIIQAPIPDSIGSINIMSSPGRFIGWTA